MYGVATDANGLYYMKARYYNIAIKRFANRDIVDGSIDAEVNAISRAFNDRADLRGATIPVANVRKASYVSGMHGTYKPPCDVCHSLIDFFGIEVIN